MKRARFGICAALSILVLLVVACSDSDDEKFFRALCALFYGNSEILVGSMDGGIFRSNNQGLLYNLEPSATQGGINDFSITLNYQLAFGNGGYVGLRSGNSWSQLSTSFTDNVNNAEPLANGSSAFVGDDGLFGKYDGLSFNTLKIGASVRYNQRGLSCYNNDICYTAGGNGSIYKTTDGGNNFSSHSSGTTSDLNAIFTLDGNTTWAVGNNATLTYTIDGTNWEVHSNTGLSGDLHDLYFWNANQGVVLGDNVYSTQDGGDSWKTEINLGFAAALKRIAVLGDLFQMVGKNESYWEGIRNGAGFDFNQLVFSASDGTQGDDDDDSGAGDDDDDSPPPPVVGDDDDDGAPVPSATPPSGPPFSISNTNVTFDHDVGTTQCPQTVGTFDVTNLTSSTQSYTISTSGPLSASPSTFSLDPGVTQIVTVQFTCAQASSFNGQVTVTSGGSTGSVTVQGNVG